MLTISQLARAAGVTVRAVRHYHARGLLPEPARDASRYRRYGTHAVIDLIRIKALTDAGVPLTRVRELLRADPDQFAHAVEAIDRDLQSRILALQAHRKQIRRLTAGDSLVLPHDVVDYLARLRTVGFSERTVATERDTWTLLSATMPEQVTEWVRQKNDFLDDPDYRSLYLDFDAAFDWHPDDLRLPALARALTGYQVPASSQRHGPGHPGFDGRHLDTTLLTLAESEMIAASPALRVLTRLLGQAPRRSRPEHDQSVL